MQWQTADIMDYGLLKENAKANRNNQTEAESCFWQLAKASGLGEKCRRQYIIGEYIVDFFFRQSMLIVEIDGGYHRPAPQQGPSKSPLKGDLDTKPLTRPSKSPLEGDLDTKPLTRPSKSPLKGDLPTKPLTGDMLLDMANSRPLRESWRGSEQIEYDRIRQDWLEHMGYTVLRFTNEQVLLDTENIIQIVKNNLKNPSSPGSSPKGGQEGVLW